MGLTPINLTFWIGLHKEGPGSPVEYDRKWDLKALMLNQLFQVPYVKDLVKHLKRDLCLREVCGYGEKAPTDATSAR